MHENAGNIGLRLDYFEHIHKHLEVNILCVAYRGYGSSMGTPSETGIKMDALAVAKFIKTYGKIN